MCGYCQLTNLGYISRWKVPIVLGINYFLDMVFFFLLRVLHVYCPLFLQVLGDIVESCAGAILLDSGLNLECVWRIMIPFLSSVVSFSNVQLNPIRELQELCQSSNFELSCEITRSHLGIFSCKKEVNISGSIFSGNASNLNKKLSEINASQDLLLKLKVKGYDNQSVPNKAWN